ncbi:unnamed protein product [Candidula unifasciata]|uniref:Caspase-8 n=1 Tax=Candidula unifasciata TaxID=100452 RepID=A0A8S3YXZ6_9EUPU|nr:unnamed protein product [Candidula unifasciata]
MKIMDRFTHDIASEVDFQYLNPHLRAIFPRIMLQRAEGRDRASYDIMTTICESARTLCMGNFLNFLAAIRIDYEHVFNLINTYYREETGHNLPNYENAQNFSQSEPILLQNSPSLAQNASFPPQNAPLPQHNASIPPQNAPLPQHNASIPPQNAFLPQHNASIPPLNASRIFQNAEPLEPNMSTAGYMDVLNSNELGTPETFHSSYNVSGSPAETTEPNISSQLRKYNKLVIENPNSLYTMESTPRGHCLIINNELFQNLPPRKGSSKDLNNLDMMFNFLGFQVVSYENKTATGMKILLEEFANSPALGQTSALAVVILSHGGPSDIIYGEDGALIDNSPVAGTFITKLQLQKVFSGTNCPSMNGKPKLFILQACRGEESEDGQENNYCRDDAPSLDHIREPETVSDDPLPEHRAETADMCFLHSSSLGYKAYRSMSQGSPFIQLFTERIFQHAHEKSLQSIVMMIQNEFSTKAITTTKMTMPEYSSSLTKKWYFNPPHGRRSMYNFGTHE